VEVDVLARFPRTAASAFLACVLFASAATAQPWQLAQSIGPVWFGEDQAKLVSVGPDAEVPGGATVVTGEGGRAMLVRGEQTMLIGPNAVVVVPDQDQSGVSTVLQRSGEVTFDVDRQKTQHFAVETPYLAAVVKGTNFTVSVNGERADVAVNRGLVEVADLATGERVDTAAGQRALVDGIGKALAISGDGLLAIITPGQPRAPLVRPLSTGELRAMQNSASGLIEAQDHSAGENGSELAAIGAGSSGAGPGSGSAGGGPVDGGRRITEDSNSQVAGLDVVPNTILKRRKTEESVSPLAFAGAAAVMALLAIGLAYVRRST
jgi:hypothetical protein